MTAQYRGVYATDLPLPDEALAAFFAVWTPAPKRTETVALEAALGRVLARDVRSNANLPERPRSAMDGFAVRSCDVRAAAPGRPCFLTLRGEPQAAGVELAAGAAARIATGGPLPAGADSIVRIEDTFLDANAVGVLRPVPSGADIVAAGEDVPAGAMLAREGSTIGVALLGVLAALGETHVLVYRRPSVAVLSTGDEVVPIAARPRAGEVRDSNATVLGALLRSFGAEAVSAGHVRDDLAALERVLADASERHDAVVLSGGSSVGTRDHTEAALAKRGAPGVVVHGVRMKPGRPVLLAASGTRPIVGLPGNPTAAMVALMVLGRSIFAKLSGRTAEPPSSYGAAAARIDGKAGWSCYVPVRLDHGAVSAVEHFCSTYVSSLLEADGYVHVGPERPFVAAGELVRVYALP